eukprot:scaffold1170_cov174-Amphora_coffeaeformis.AAC.2
MESIAKVLSSPILSTAAAAITTIVLAYATWKIVAEYLSSPGGSAGSSHSAARTIAKKNEKRQKRSIMIKCPFTAETSFVVETAEHLPPHPCDIFEDWTTHYDGSQPMGVRWLNAGISGQDSPGVLRAGLKRLRDGRWFLVEEPFRLKEELLLKQQALDDPGRFPKVYVQEKDSIQAQEEVLELFLHYLPRRYPEMYMYDEDAQTITVVPFDNKTFYIPDFASRPLELCERIVQEDLILLRPARPTDPFTAFAMAAAAVVFSFGGLQEKLCKPVEFIHAPVPGFEKYLRKTLELTFGKLLKVEQPMWRNNWLIAQSGELSSAELYAGDENGSARELKQPPTLENIRKLFVKVEYQTIRRLPRSGYLLFTAKLMSDGLSSLEHYPKAGKCLAASIRGMSKPMRAYKGISDDETCQAILKYLDSIAGSNELHVK